MSLCMYVARIARISKKTCVQNLQNVLHVLTVGVAWSSDDGAVRYLLPALRMMACFLHNRPYGAWR